MLLLFLPCPLPFPPPRRYDSLDSATNGRSDLDSASGSSRRTSRQYSLDSRHSLSDRWVSVAPSPPPSFSSCCSSLWFHAAVMMSWIWTCLVLWSLLCLHACAQPSSFTCITYIDYIYIYISVSFVLVVFLFCAMTAVYLMMQHEVILMCLTECFWFSAAVCHAVSGQLSVSHSKEEWYACSSDRLLFACLLPDSDRIVCDFSMSNFSYSNCRAVKKPMFRAGSWLVCGRQGVSEISGFAPQCLLAFSSFHSTVP